MTGRLRRQPLKISLPNRNRNIIKAAQPQNPTVAYNGPTPRGGLDYSRPRLPTLLVNIFRQSSYLHTTEMWEFQKFFRETKLSDQR